MARGVLGPQARIFGTLGPGIDGIRGGYRVYVYPKEGYTGWMDNLAVAKGAPNLDTAKAFINFAMAPENAAMITNYARYSNGIKGAQAFIEPALVAAPEITPPADAPAPEFIPTCSPTATALIDKVWTKLMN